MRRHFIEHDDFNLFVATSARFEHPSVPSLEVKRHPALVRLSNTRFSRWVRQFEMAVESTHIPAEVFDAAYKFKPDARQFRPDLAFPIGGSWNWTAMMAGNIARRLGVPLVASFNDWFDYGVIIHPRLRGVVEKAFRHLYRSCDLALCTSEGMRDALGSNPNAHVLYPIGATVASQTVEFAPHQPESGPATVAFTGNVGINGSENFVRPPRFLLRNSS